MEVTLGHALIASAIVLVGMASALVIMREKVRRLRDVSAAAYHLAGHLNMDDASLDDDDFYAGCELLLDVLADPDGKAAKELVAAPAGVSYVALRKKITMNKSCGPAPYGGCCFEAPEDPTR